MNLQGNGAPEWQALISYRMPRSLATLAFAGTTDKVVELKAGLTLPPHKFQHRWSVSGQDTIDDRRYDDKIIREAPSDMGEVRDTDSAMAKRCTAAR